MAAFGFSAIAVGHVLAAIVDWGQVESRTYYVIQFALGTLAALAALAQALGPSARRWVSAGLLLYGLAYVWGGSGGVLGAYDAWGIKTDAARNAALGADQLLIGVAIALVWWAMPRVERGWRHLGFAASFAGLVGSLALRLLAEGTGVDHWFSAVGFGALAVAFQVRPVTTDLAQRENRT